MKELMKFELKTDCEPAVEYLQELKENHINEVLSEEAGGSGHRWRAIFQAIENHNYEEDQYENINGEWFIA